MLNLYPTQPHPDRLGQIIGRDGQGKLLAELHHAVGPELLQFYVVHDDGRSDRTPRNYLVQVVDIGYARQASNDANFGVYVYRRNQDPDTPLSNDDQAIIAKNIIALRVLGWIDDQKIREAFSVPGILSFLRRPSAAEYSVLAQSPLNTLAI